jgi:hypothetical protein
MKKVLSAFLRTLRTTTVVVLGMVIACLFLLQSDGVQNRLSDLIEAELSRMLKGVVSLDKIEVDLPARIVLTHVVMKDPEGEVVATIGSVKISLLDLNVWRLLRGGEKEGKFNVNSVWLNRPDFHLYRRGDDCKLNIEYLLGEKSSDEPRKPGNLALHITHLHIDNGRFRFEDYSQRSPDARPTPGKIDFAYVDARAIYGHFDVRYEDRIQELVAKIHSLSAHEVRSGFRLESLAVDATFAPTEGVFPAVKVCNLDLVAAGSHLRLDAMLVGEVNLVHDSLGHEPPASVLLRQSELDFALLNYFLPNQLPLQGKVRFQGQFNGSADSLFSEDFRLAFGQNSDLSCTAKLEHLLNPDQLSWEFDFAPSRLDFAELDSMLVADLPLLDTVRLAGLVKGDLRKIRSKNLELTFGRQSHLHADVRIDDYDKPDLMILNLKLKPSHMSLGELHKVLPQLKLPKEIDRLGAVDVEGDYLGGIYDFVVNAGMNSKEGSLKANLHMQLPPKVGKMTYTGWLTTQNLNVDALHLTEGSISHRLNFDGSITGSGQNIEDLQLAFSGRADNSEFFGYDLENLTIDSVSILGQNLQGTIKIKDSHGQADVAITVALDQQPHQYEIQGAFKQFDLKHYFGTKDSLFLSSIINLKLTGDSIENYVGRAKFFDLNLENRTNDHDLKLHDLIVKSEKNTPEYKELKITSSLFDLEMDGNFSFTRGGKLMERLLKESRLYAKNSDTAIQNYYSHKIPDSVFTQINYSLTTKPELNGFFHFFDIPVYLAASSMLVGEFSSLATDTVDWMFVSDSIDVAGTGLKEVNFTFSAEKPGKSNDVTASGDLTIARVVVSPQLRFEEVEFEPTFQRNKIQYWLSGHQRDLGNHFRLSAETTFLTDWVVTRINPKVSYIRLKDAEWSINSMNSIVSEGGRVTFEDLELNNGIQRITFNGVASKSQADTLVVGLADVSIGSIMRLFQNDTLIGGNIALAEARLSGLFGKPRMVARGLIQNFSYKRISGVQIRAETFMSTGGSSPFIGGRTEWSFAGQRVMKLSGHYRLRDEELNFVSDSAQIPLNWLSSFAEPWITHLGGIVKVDQFSIKGKPTDVRLEGTAHFQGAHATVDYFKQAFWLDDASIVQFDKEKITFPDLHLYSDSVGGGDCRVNGNILYGGVKKIMLDLKVDQVKELHVMNTTLKDNELFYGNAYIGSGDATIKGPYDDITISARLSSGRNSWLDIPIADYTSASRLDFLSFVGGTDTLVKKTKRTFAGYNLDILMDVRPDAKVRIIFDEQVGDIIEANGEGSLRMIINEQGEFKMSGNYNVISGNYLFTAENIVNKEFLLERDGSITWDGDAYDAQLELNAVYKVNASISSLIGTSGGSARVPVEIIMHMKGSLASPQITLDLRIDKLTEDDVVGLSSYLRNITYDEQELNRQVVSLLMFRRFAPATTGSGQDAGAGSAISSSLSELVANQLNNWIAQSLNANVGVNVGTNQFQDVELGIKATLFGDKVTVERNGTVLGRRGNGGGIGDISVIVKLLPIEREDSTGVKAVDPYKGQLVMEIFNRENVNVNYTYSNVSGAGLFFKKDFDRIAELFQSRKKQREQREKDKVVD